MASFSSLENKKRQPHFTGLLLGLHQFILVKYLVNVHPHGEGGHRDELLGILLKETLIGPAAGNAGICC